MRLPYFSNWKSLKTMYARPRIARHVADAFIRLDGRIGKLVLGAEIQLEVELRGHRADCAMKSALPRRR